MAKPTDELTPHIMRIPPDGDTSNWPTPRAIRIVRPGQQEAIIPLVTERLYQLGRAETVDLYFEDESISRFHGFLYYDPSFAVWAYRDAASSYGSALADPRGGSRRQPLSPGKPAVMLAGNVLALGTRGSRIEFLKDMPPEAITTPGAAPWRSEAARALEERIQVASGHSLPLLLLGASGSGKTYVANRIHQLSGRRGRFVGINCTHLPADPTALRSELLGHAKGAFTGAIEAKAGQLFLADGGTLFLDEVESLGQDTQAFLLTVLEGSDELVPLGAPASKGRPRPSFRLVSATKQRLNESRLRHDLAQRLGAGDFIHIPSLEERAEDIPTLALRFVEELAAEQQVDCALSPEALAYLTRQRWPGQIRELQATVKATAVRCWWRTNNAGSTERRRVVVGVIDFQVYLAERAQAFGATVGVPPSPEPPAPPLVTTPQRKRPVDLTREDLESALREAGGSRSRAAQALGISPTTFRKKLREFDL